VTDRVDSALTRDELVELFALADTTAVYDVFAEAVSSVQARYVAAIHAARSEAERALWTERSVALRHYKRAVGPDDRDAMIDGILLLKTEHRQLQVGAAQSVA
jgi:hypothetical protein